MSEATCPSLYWEAVAVIKAKEAVITHTSRVQKGNLLWTTEAHMKNQFINYTSIPLDRPIRIIKINIPLHLDKLPFRANDWMKTKKREYKIIKKDSILTDDRNDEAGKRELITSWRANAFEKLIINECPLDATSNGRVSLKRSCRY